MSTRTVTTILIVIVLTLFFTGCAENRIATRENNVQALQDMGNSLVRQGDLRGGLEHLLKAVEQDPENPDLHHQLGLVYRNLGEYERSLQHLQKTLRLRPDFPEARNNIGTLYLLIREWDLAIESFQSAIDNLLFKTPGIAYNNMGLAYYYKGEYQKAINNYLMALKAYPSYADCNTNLGIAYEALKRWDKAIEAYKKAIQYGPVAPAPYIRLGRLYNSLNRKDEAIRVLKQVSSIVKEGPDAEEARRLLKEIER